MISALTTIVVAGVLFFFLTVILPVFLLAAGFNMFVAPTFNLPPVDFLQALGLFLLVLGVKWAGDFGDKD